MEILRWKNIAGRTAFHAARDTKTEAIPLRDHGHDFAEIFWIDAGEGTHRVNGGLFPLRLGSLVLIRPEDWHGIDVPHGVSLRLTNVAFPREVLDFFKPRYASGSAWPFSPAGKYPLAREIESFQLHRYNQWADELARSPRERLYLDRFLLNVLADLNAQPAESTLSEAPPWLAQACRAMQSPEHFSRGVEEFLRRCGRSREHVARTVQHYLGTTPTAYVNAIRMEYAQRQLEMGDESILDIALACGMENLSHFYVQFRATTGMTPRKYRLTHRKPV